VLQWVLGCPKSGDYPFHDLRDKVDDEQRNDHSGETPDNPLLSNVTLGVIRDPGDPECIDYPQNNEKAAYATTDIHITSDAVCTAPGVCGGLQGVAAAKNVNVAG
jgi:hypothetical protein